MELDESSCKKCYKGNAAAKLPPLTIPPKSAATESYEIIYIY